MKGRKNERQGRGDEKEKECREENVHGKIRQRSIGGLKKGRKTEDIESEEVFIS